MFTVSAQYRSLWFDSCVNRGRNIGFLYKIPHTPVETSNKKWGHYGIFNMNVITYVASFVKTRRLETLSEVNRGGYCKTKLQPVVAHTR